MSSFLSVEPPPPPDLKKHPFAGLPGAPQLCTIQWGCLQCGHRFETKAPLNDSE
jgi:hypothetical protein